MNSRSRDLSIGHAQGDQAENLDFAGREPTRNGLTEGAHRGEQSVDSIDRRLCMERSQEIAGLDQIGLRVYRRARRQPQLGTGNQCQGALVRDRASIGQRQCLSQVTQGRVEFPRPRAELAPHPERGNQRERLPRISGRFDGQPGVPSREDEVAGLSAVPGPAQSILGPAQHGAAPIEPAIVCFDPGQRG